MIGLTGTTIARIAIMIALIGIRTGLIGNQVITTPGNIFLIKIQKDLVFIKVNSIFRYHYYDDRRSERGSSRRQHQESYSHSSRPSSRQGYYHPDYSYSYAPAPYAPVAAPAPPAPDANTLEIFRKNWEYYSRNPAEMEKLRISQPAKHQNLLNYYHHYNQFLPQITERPPSRANSVNNMSQFKTDQSTILHPDGLEQSQNYQPTPEVSKVDEEISEIVKNEPEIGKNFCLCSLEKTSIFHIFFRHRNSS